MGGEEEPGPMAERPSSARYEPPSINLQNRNDSHTLIVELVGTGNLVLEVGTSTGYLTRLLRDLGNRVIGIEVDEEAAKIAEDYCDLMIPGDVEEIDLDDYLAPASIDLAVFGDVLEHLRYPAAVLKKVRRYLKPHGSVVVSIPNVCHGDVLISLLNGDFRYTSMGLLDETHLRFFGLKNVFDLLAGSGYEVEEVRTTRHPVGGTELRREPEEVPAEIRRFIEGLPNSDVYQFVLLARPSADPKSPPAPAADLKGIFDRSVEPLLREHEEPLRREVVEAMAKSQEASERLEALKEELEMARERGQSLELAVSEREGRIAELLGEVEEAREQAKSLDQVVLEGEARISELSCELEEARERVKSLDQAVSEREGSIYELGLKLQRSFENIQSLNFAVADRDNRIDELEDRFKQSENRALLLENEISEMRRSAVWQLTMRFHNGFVEPLLPIGTERRGIYDLGLRANRILVNEGWKSLWLAYKQKKYRELYNNSNPAPPAAQSDINQILKFYYSNESSPHIKTHQSSVDIIICVHNALNDVKKCLESVIKFTSYPYSLILVDDGSDTQTRTYLDDFAKIFGAYLIRNETAKGYTIAANQGLKHSSGDYLVLLNSDTVVATEWLDRMIECAKSDDRVGIVGPLSNTASWQSVPEIEIAGDWAKNELPEDVSVEKMSRLVAKYSARLYPRLPFLNGFCLLIKRSLIDDIGYFDEANFGRGYGEENDYCIRAKESGWVLQVADDVYIFHAQSSSYSDEKRITLCKISDDALKRKHIDIDIGQRALECRYDRTLEGIRARTKALYKRERLIIEAKKRWEGKRVLIVLPIIDPGGGAYVIIQESRSMLNMGIDVRLFNLSEYKDFFIKNYPDLDVPVIFGSRNDLASLSKNYDAIVATVNTSVDWLIPSDDEGASSPKKVYYIQDFEPYFYPEGSGEYQKAWNSYKMYPDLIRITKTRWNADLIKDKIGVDTSLLGPSVDLDLFRPRPRIPFMAQKRPIHIAAMIRPSTPRRNPSFTMKILRDLCKIKGDNIKIILFGSSVEELKSVDYSNDFDYIHVGLLGRKEVSWLFNEIDIFVDFSSYQAMGLTALEAMACGSAVIVPKNGGTSDFVTHELNGLMVDTSSEDECLNALNRLVDDDTLRERLGLQAMRDACKYPPEVSAYKALSQIFK
jgi:GT2 family glycosyltransferase/glycosyltransferase involved in cell wall biosynthesis/SAM-dependent methyltransferase